MTTLPTFTEFEKKLARSLREAPAQPTPACCEEETLWDFAEQGGQHPDALALIRHVSTCAYCTQGYFAMKETLQLRRELAPVPTPAPVPVSPPASAVPAQETDTQAAPPPNKPVPNKPVPTWRERLQTLAQAPRTRLRLQWGGMALAGMAVTLLLVWPRVMQTRLAAASASLVTRKLQQSEEDNHQLREKLARQSQEAQAEIQGLKADAEKERRVAAQALESARKKEVLANAKLQSLSAPPNALPLEATFSERIIADGRGKFRYEIPLDLKEERALRSHSPVLPGQMLASLVKQGGATMGGPGEEPIALLHPNGTLVSSLRPAFIWKPVPRAAGYRLTCIPQNANDDAEAAYTISAGANQAKSRFTWQIPPTSTALTPATTYAWTVEALDAGGKSLALSPTNEAIFFRTLTPAELDEVTRKRRQYADTPLLMGALYARLGVLEEAEQAFARCLQTDPDNQAARRLLRQVRAQQTLGR